MAKNLKFQSLWNVNVSNWGRFDEILMAAWLHYRWYYKQYSYEKCEEKSIKIIIDNMKVDV